MTYRNESGSGDEPEQKDARASAQSINQNEPQQAPNGDDQSDANAHANGEQAGEQSKQEYAPPVPSFNLSPVATLLLRERGPLSGKVILCVKDEQGVRFYNLTKEQ